MRGEGMAAVRLSRSRMADLYWTPAQMLAHHTSNGCNLNPGDLFASGTISGPEKESRGCLLELTWRGAEPLTLPTGESRKFLEDGDEVVMRGWCEREGFARIGFGECRGMVMPGELAAQAKQDLSSRAKRGTWATSLKAAQVPRPSPYFFATT